MAGGEERVLVSLAKNGGEMFQSELVRQTELSRSRTSEILTSLEKRMLVSRFQQGRNYRVVLKTDTAKKTTLVEKNTCALGSPEQRNIRLSYHFENR